MMPSYEKQKKLTENTEEKAKMIALAAGKKLKDCVKVDFRPFEERVISNSEISETSFRMAKFSEASIEERIQNAFTPEDVEVIETLYCLWIAE